ncbi:hypothetical protein C0J52_04182 [Blattella germanica]|nr:hypothetical protein C0J52_04182 [Blattella germanica]
MKPGHSVITMDQIKEEKPEVDQDEPLENELKIEPEVKSRSVNFSLLTLTDRPTLFVTGELITLEMYMFFGNKASISPVHSRVKSRDLA